MYRGVRTKYPECIIKNGMSYYWDSPEYAVEDVFRALRKNGKLMQLGRNELVRSMLVEATRSHRIQLFATEDKVNAMSYARATPELIFLVLDYALVERKTVYKYLDNCYGKPHVVTFYVDDIIQGINERMGNFIPAEQITAVEPIDMEKPDPWFEKLKAC